MSPLRSFSFVFIGLLLFALFGCSQDPEASLERARQLAASGDLVSATLELKSAIQAEPKNAEMRLFLGQLYLQQYASPSAIKELERALSLGIAELETATLALAHAYFRADDRENIHEIAIDDNFADATKASILAMQGHLLARQKDIPEARNKLDAARQLDENNLEAHFLAAQLKLYEREIDAAYQEIDAVLKQDPKHEIALTFKATIARANGQPDIELEAVNTILDNYPKNFEIRVARSNILIAKGDLEGARADVNYLAKNFRNQPQTKVQRGVLSLADGNAGAALDLAREALSDAPEMSDALLLAGLAQKRLGSLTQAADFITQFINKVPYNLYSRKVLAEIRLKQGDSAAALKILEPLINLGFEDAGIFNLAAVAKQSLGDTETADQWFSKAVELDPDNSAITQTKALAALQSGDVEAGLNSLEAAMASSGSVGAAEELVVLTLLKRQEFDRAASIIEKLERREPDSALVFNLKGLVESSRQAYPAARQAFEKSQELNANFLPPVTNLAEIDAREGKIEDAAKRFQNYLADHDKAIPAYLSLATLQAKFANNDEALATLEKAYKVDRDNKAVVMPLLGEYFSRNRDRDAESVAFLALKSHPEDAALINALAEAELRTGAKNKAIATIERLLSLPQRDAQTYVSVAQFQFRAGKPDIAEQTIQDGLRTYPGQAPLHIQLMAMYNQLRQFDKATAHANSVQKERPDAPFGYLIEGELHEVRGHYDKAVAAYDEALERQAAGPFAVKRFIAAEQLNRTSAMSWLSKWVEAHPAEAAARGRLADELARDKQFQAAIQHYERMLADKTFQISTLNGLAWAYYSVGDNRAQTLAEAAYLQGGFSPYIADTLGWILVEKGDIAGGLPYLEKAATRAPEDANVRLHYAQALIRADRPDAAKTELLAIKALTTDSEVAAQASALLKTL